MISGFVLVNYTTSRRTFLRLLHDSSEPVYIAFFALTGAALQLGSLVGSIPAATLTFALRLLGIVVGTRLGGRAGGAPPEHTDRYWMAFVTQAGVTLGLASRIAAEFWYGPQLATLITAVVVVNQLIGPLLF